MTYRVIYHVGESIDISTKAATGRLALDNGLLEIVGVPRVTIPVGTLQGVELFRLHGSARMLKISHAAGTLFVSVIRFSFFGYFAVINFFGTGRLQRELEDVIRAVNPPAPNPDAPLDST